MTGGDGWGNGRQGTDGRGNGRQGTDGRDGDPHDADEYAITLLRRLDDEPSRPSRVDLFGAIAEGRRRRRMRRLAGAGGTATLTVAVLAALPLALSLVRAPDPLAEPPASSVGSAAAPATPEPTPSVGPPGGARTPVPGIAPPTRCAVELLTIPDDVPMSLVTGIDPTGRFILGRSYPDKAERSYPVLIWQEGRPTHVKMPGEDQRLADATSEGVAVGYSWVDGVARSYHYHQGSVRALTGRSVTAEAINEAGRIVGTRNGSQPVLWPSASVSPVELALPGPSWRGEAVDIDEDGTVVGAVQSDDAGEEQAQIWLPGERTGQLLPMPIVDGEPAASFRPQTIRNGWVTGLAGGVGGQSGQPTIPVRLNLATGHFVDFPEHSLWPQSGNGQGWVVGTTDDDRAGLLTDAGLLELPGTELIDLPEAGLVRPPGSARDGHDAAGDGDIGNIAWSVSDDGRTIGGQGPVGSDGDPRALVWRCR